jgi:hypothetical protein
MKVRGFYLQKLGTKPPVKTTGYGKATPATWPSISKRASRNGPWPKVIPDGSDGKKALAALKYYGQPDE